MIESVSMQENEPVEKKRNNPSAPRGGPPKITRHCFSFEERLRAVKLHLEEGFTQEMVARELGISSAAVHKWVARYRLQGEAALKGQYGARPGLQLPQPIRDKILQLKKEEPTRGIKKISQEKNRGRVSTFDILSFRRIAGACPIVILRCDSNPPLFITQPVFIIKERRRHQSLYNKFPSEASGGGK
jgi:transposase-like protein